MQRIASLNGRLPSTAYTLTARKPRRHLAVAPVNGAVAAVDVAIDKRYESV